MKEESRYRLIESKVSAGENIYPYDFKETHQIAEILQYVRDQKITPENSAESLALGPVRTAGRVLAVRTIGKISFIKIESESASIQVISREKLKDLFRGDILGASGEIGFSKKGELSVLASSVQVLAPCLHTFPTEHYGLKETEARYRQRYLDLVTNKSTLKTFKIRNQVIFHIRKYLNGKNFMEVETPMMHIIPGGAAAKPFKTTLNEMSMDLTMRISPELHLKTLLVGGLPRVYEIGKQFRNEGMDATHNPEFTTCEFYMAYADYNDVLEMTEEMISGMVESIFGKTVIEYYVDEESQIGKTSHEGGVDLKSIEEACPGKNKKRVRIDFTAPFKRVDILQELSRKLGEEISPDVLETPEGQKLLDRLCREKEVKCSSPRTASRLLDKLIGHFLESECTDPTFLMNHPKIMSPLAKEHRTRRNLTERFELFILGKEVCNAYTELNDPFDQRRRFNQQASDKSAGDDEAQEIDEDFCTALEYGMPPAGGWGIGIDRLVMMLAGAQSIRDVIFFPTMKPRGEVPKK
ncbi:lysyl-tRNA synthetase, class II [Nematocida major]|uniref:lysyl-tRNA synthetase, class II n=1 Tax=Nematocida major TaxID=1912982 RepID=UPI00200864B7|nr:lysyl-tRNA synthetase, class II [Nematocida major]KAH9385308.1 lysyl-tRNA synthetase, class II [Nematocida major]